MPFNPFSALTSKIFAGASLALLVACALLWFRLWQVERDRDSWRLAHKAQREATEAVAQAARAKALAAKIEAESQSIRKAERADHDLASLRNQVRAANARYAAAHRLRPEVAGAAPGGPAAATDDHGPEGPDGPGAGAELVAVSQRDFDILVDNTARLIAAHQWAKSLNEGGVPEPAF